MADLDIIRIKRGPSKLGSNPLFKLLQVDSIADAYASHIALSAAVLGFEAVQSSIPVDTGELRSSVNLAQQGTTYKISIPSTSHASSRSPISNAKLAIELSNNSLYKRSKDSLGAGLFSSISKGSATAGWDLAAQGKFERSLVGLR